MSERCLHNEVCKYGEKRSNGMYCTEEKCKQFKNRTKYVEVVRCKDCIYYEIGKDYEPYCNHVTHGIPYAKADDFCSYGEKKPKPNITDQTIDALNKMGDAVHGG